MFHELLSRDCKVAVAAGDSCKMRVKFKFKFVLTTVSYRAFCLFLFYKIMFNFKFKLILRKKKYMSTVFLRIFSYLWFWLVGLVGHLEKSPRPPRLARMAGGRGDFKSAYGKLDSGYPPSADSGMTPSDSKCRGGVYPRPKRIFQKRSSRAGLDSTQRLDLSSSTGLIAGRTGLESLLLTFVIY